MCRILAVPPGTTRSAALTMIMDMRRKRDKDGVGSVHVTDPGPKGRFNVTRYPCSISTVLRNRQPFLNHMPHNGWTLIHIRASSVGINSIENTHPFTLGDWCMVHNGVWSGYRLARLLFERLGKVKLIGNTDSEVALHLLATLGPIRFTEELDWAGVFMGLKRDGSLWAMKTSGDLAAMEENGRLTLGSTFDRRVYRKAHHYEVGCGAYHMGPDGQIVHREPMPEKDPKKTITVDGERFPLDPDMVDDERLYSAAFAEPFARGGEAPILEGEILEELEQISAVKAREGAAPKEPMTLAEMVRASDLIKARAAEKQAFLNRAMGRVTVGPNTPLIIQGPNASASATNVSSSIFARPSVPTRPNAIVPKATSVLKLTPQVST